MDELADMRGKTCLITGGSAGIGKHTAILLARLGARVILVTRPSERASRAQNEVIRKSRSDAVDLIPADLSLMEDVRRLADEVTRRYSRLDVLINNAAVFKVSRVITPEGLELMFATNYLAPFLLTLRLVDLLKASSDGQVINLTAPSTDSIDFDNLQGEKGFFPLQTFSRTKMALLLFTLELARHVAGTPVRVNALYPGLARTRLMREASFKVRVFIYMSAYTPPHAAQAVLALLQTPAHELETPNGGFYYEGKELALDAYVLDREVQDHLWEISETMTGVSFNSGIFSHTGSIRNP